MSCFDSTGPDGQPFRGAWAYVSRVGGLRVQLDEGGPETDANGVTEFTVPAGSVELKARKDKLEGRITVNEPEGGAVDAEIRLAPKADAQ